MCISIHSNSNSGDHLSAVCVFSFRHLAWSAGAEHVGVGQQTLGDAPAAEGAGGRGHGTVAGLVRRKSAGAAHHRPAAQVILAVAAGAVSHLLKQRHDDMICPSPVLVFSAEKGFPSPCRHRHLQALCE